MYVKKSLLKQCYPYFKISSGILSPPYVPFIDAEYKINLQQKELCSLKIHHRSWFQEPDLLY